MLIYYHVATPQASRCALVLGFLTASRILRSDVSDAKMQM
jgi:hypothetical protein